MRDTGLIYHMCRQEEWRAALETGRYLGSSQDREDGFIHFSTALQIKESAARHRAGQTGLALLAVRPEALGESLKWEPARNGDLFPHVYGGIPVAAAHWVKPLPLGADGVHLFPPLEP